MGDNSCLIHGFSYASAIPNDSKQGTPMHALGESISFGRFMTESLSWDRWSTFSSHKKYVEEAERYAQPGSVAQKKAFFEAHYKRIAAQRAAALLEQENASKNAAAGVAADRDDYSEQADILYSDVVTKIADAEIQDSKDDDFVDTAEHLSTALLENGSAGSTITSANDEDSVENPVKANSMKELDDVGSHEGDNVSETSGVILMERPLLKNRGDIPSATSKNKSGLSSSKTTSISNSKQWKVPSTPTKQVVRVNKENNTNTISRKPIMELIDKRRSAAKSLWSVMNVGSNVKEPDKEPISTTNKNGRSGLAHIHSKEPKYYAASPFRTPIAAASKGVFTSPAATPRSTNRRLKTPKIDPSGSKSAGPKWHILSAVCSKSFTACRNRLQTPTLSTPFVLRTEERAARRKQKLEDKFSASDMPVQKTLKEKAGKEFSKLGCGFCFKATPLPDFYKETQILKNHQVKKDPATQYQSTTLGRTTQGTASVPPTPPKCIAKNDASKNLARKKVHKPSQFRRDPLLEKNI